MTPQTVASLPVTPVIREHVAAISSASRVTNVALALPLDTHAARIRIVAAKTALAVIVRNARPAASKTGVSVLVAQSCSIAPDTDSNLPTLRTAYISGGNRTVLNMPCRGPILAGTLSHTQRVREAARAFEIGSRGESAKRAQPR